MGRDRVALEQNAPPDLTKIKLLNLGCGFKQAVGAVNVDAFDICKPDIVWDLNKTPWTWAKDDEFDQVWAHHVFEHLYRDRWWDAFCEVARVLKVGGLFDMRVPDESSSSALGYKDHHTMFTFHTFHGIKSNEAIWCRGATNAWARTIEHTIPMECIQYVKVPFAQYNWMRRTPRLLNFCANHMRNFIWEQIFIFRKISDREMDHEGTSI